MRPSSIAGLVILLIVENSYATNLTLVSKCCEIMQVYHEKKSVCVEGSFNLTALRSEYMAADIGFDNEVAFETGAVKAEDCENGSLRCV